MTQSGNSTLIFILLDNFNSVNVIFIYVYEYLLQIINNIKHTYKRTYIYVIYILTNHSCFLFWQIVLVRERAHRHCILNLFVNKQSQQLKHTYALYFMLLLLFIVFYTSAVRLVDFLNFFCFLLMFFVARFCYNLCCCCCSFLFHYAML